MTSSKELWHADNVHNDWILTQTAPSVTAAVTSVGTGRPALKVTKKCCACTTCHSGCVMGREVTHPPLPVWVPSMLFLAMLLRRTIMMLCRDAAGRGAL